MSVTRPPAGWYPEPGHQDSLRYWDGDAWTERRTGVGLSRPAEPYRAVGRVAAFIALSVPLLFGFYVWGSAIVFAWGVIPLAAVFGPHIWPTVKGGEAALVATLVAGIVWLPSFAGERNLLIALCGPDFAGVVVPAGLATAAYLVVGILSALTQRVVLWVAAAPLVPLVFLAASHWVDALITC